MASLRLPMWAAALRWLCERKYPNFAERIVYGVRAFPHCYVEISRQAAKNAKLKFLFTFSLSALSAFA